MHKMYSDYIESTNENSKTSSSKRRESWGDCQLEVRKYLEPLVNLQEFIFAYPTNGIHESIDWMCNKIEEYQVFKGEYRYSSFIKMHLGNVFFPEEFPRGGAATHKRVFVCLDFLGNVQTFGVDV